MAIEPKKDKETEKMKPLVFRNNPEVKLRIDAHKKANPEDAVFYTRLVRENPERAIETFLYRDMLKHEAELKLIARQLPGAKAFYDEQSVSVKARIDRALKDVNPYYKDKAFVNAVLREKNYEARRDLMTPPSQKLAA